MSEFQVSGTNKAALFTLKIHRGDGMALIAMDWKAAKSNAAQVTSLSTIIRARAAPRQAT